MCSSPLLPRPFNPYHASELYLGSLLKLLGVHGFRIDRVYGGRKMGKLEWLSCVLGLLTMFLLSKISSKTYLLYGFLRSIYNLLWKRSAKLHLIDPDPSFFAHEEVKALSNMALYRYFLVCATFMIKPADAV
jgi:hypothetical protein